MNSTQVISASDKMVLQTKITNSEKVPNRINETKKPLKRTNGKKKIQYVCDYACVCY